MTADCMITKKSVTLGSRGLGGHGPAALSAHDSCLAPNFLCPVSLPPGAVAERDGEDAADGWCLAGGFGQRAVSSELMPVAAVVRLVRKPELALTGNLSAIF